MPTTPNHGIFYADTGTNASLATITSTMASSVESALGTVDANLEKYGITQVADYAALTAFTNYVDGTRVYVIDEKTTYYRTSSGWVVWDKPRTQFTPIWVNFTVDSGGTNVGYYSVSSGLLQGFVRADGKATGAATFQFPLQPIETVPSANNLMTVGGAVMWDSSAGVAGRHHGFCILSTAGGITGGSPRFINLSTGMLTNISASQPFTWDTGDRIYADFHYHVMS